LQLNIEVASVRKIAVVPNVTGILPEKARIILEPSEVTIRAVQGDLRRVTSVTTDPINATDLVAQGKIVAGVQVKPEGLRIDSIEPWQVSVTIKQENP
jgi:hypothetical protein